MGVDGFNSDAVLPTDSCAGATTDGEWDCKIGYIVEMNFL